MAGPAPRLLLLLALAAGFGTGALGRFLHDRVRLPPARQRAASLEQALRAWEAGEAAEAARALATFRALGRAPREDVAEAALLGTLLGGAPEGPTPGRDAALARVAEAWPGTQAAGRAAWERVRRLPRSEGRRRALDAFRDAYPDAWVLRVEASRGAR